MPRKKVAATFDTVVVLTLGNKQSPLIVAGTWALLQLSRHPKRPSVADFNTLLANNLCLRRPTHGVYRQTKRQTNR